MRCIGYIVINSTVLHYTALYYVDSAANSDESPTLLQTVQLKAVRADSAAKDAAHSSQ